MLVKVSCMTFAPARSSDVKDALAIILDSTSPVSTIKGATPMLTKVSYHDAVKAMITPISKLPIACSIPPIAVVSKE